MSTCSLERCSDLAEEVLIFELFDLEAEKSKIAKKTDRNKIPLRALLHSFTLKNWFWFFEARNNCKKQSFYLSLAHLFVLPSTLKQEETLGKKMGEKGNPQKNCSPNVEVLQPIYFLMLLLDHNTNDRLEYFCR